MTPAPSSAVAMIETALRLAIREVDTGWLGVLSDPAKERLREKQREDAARRGGAVPSDAIANGDAEMAHAIGNRARNATWLHVAEVYQTAHPDTADSAAALAYVEANTSGAAYNLSNQLTYSAPLD